MIARSFGTDLSLGTLKKGYTNYERYMKLAVASRKAKFLGNATSRHPFPLVLRPMTRLPGGWLITNFCFAHQV